MTPSPAVAAPILVAVPPVVAPIESQPAPTAAAGPMVEALRMPPSARELQLSPPSVELPRPTVVMTPPAAAPSVAPAGPAAVAPVETVAGADQEIPPAVQDAMNAARAAEAAGPDKAIDGGSASWRRTRC